MCFAATGWLQGRAAKLLRARRRSRCNAGLEQICLAAIVQTAQTVLDPSPETLNPLPNHADLRLPAALYEQLRALRPPFASINDLEAFGRVLAQEGERREDSTLRELGQLLLRLVEAFDMAGLRQQIEALQAAAQPGE